MCLQVEDPPHRPSLPTGHVLVVNSAQQQHYACGANGCSSSCGLVAAATMLQRLVFWGGVSWVVVAVFGPWLVATGYAGCLCSSLCHCAGFSYFTPRIHSLPPPWVADCGVMLAAGRFLFPSTCHTLNSSACSSWGHHRLLDACVAMCVLIGVAGSFMTGLWLPLNIQSGVFDCGFS